MDFRGYRGGHYKYNCRFLVLCNVPRKEPRIKSSKVSKATDSIKSNCIEKDNVVYKQGVDINK